MIPAWDDLSSAAAEHGLILRGGFHPGDADDAPRLEGGAPAATLILLGNAGPDMWRAFSDSAEAADGRPHALDRWTRRVAEALAERFGARPVFPFEGPPYHPFQRWAKRAEPVFSSPLGLLIHPEFGLWHGYRAALAFGEALSLPAFEPRESPCTRCEARPCLFACPVVAFTDSGYNVSGCRAYLATPEGASCVERGCLARRACPVGRAYLYEPPQAEWHMRAFAKS